MSLPSLNALAWPPRGNSARTSMMTDDEEDPDVVPAAPAPAGIVPPSMLTERKKNAVREYIRKEMYYTYQAFLESEMKDPDAITLAGQQVLIYEYESWKMQQAKRDVDFRNSDAPKISDNLWKHVFAIIAKSREAVTEFAMDLYANFETTTYLAAHLDNVASAAAQMVDDYMAQDNLGFFDKAAEDLKVTEMGNQLRDMVDPTPPTLVAG